ncbi:MAG: HAMP domain-containing histidine kinase [Oscillospiraceae bacterium]|nr:HAMP domain-containing histidine kinase [Oscillospiraceae bacterium]
MEQTENYNDLLDVLLQPAFSVEQGVITAVNRGAAQLFLEPGTAVESLLATGQAEYAQFNGGCLYLTLLPGSEPRSARVIRKGGADIFILDPQEDLSQLNALALAARELRNPLADILATVDRLFPAIDEQEDPAVQQGMAAINKGLFRLQRLVCNMSDASRYRTLCRKQTVELQEMLGKLLSEAAYLCREAGVTLDYQNLKQSLYCSADAEMLERAIYNLISNSLKFSPKGSTVGFSAVKRGSRVYLTVTDSGSGISPDLYVGISRRYIREPGIEDGRFGIGLGMAMVQAAAAAHGGVVLFDPSREQGAQITLTLSLDDSKSTSVRSDIYTVDYAGERHHGLIELSDSLPAHVYGTADID